MNTSGITARDIKSYKHLISSIKKKTVKVLDDKTETLFFIQVRATTRDGKKVTCHFTALNNNLEEALEKAVTIHLMAKNLFAKQLKQCVGRKLIIGSKGGLIPGMKGAITVMCVHPQTGKLMVLASKDHFADQTPIFKHFRPGIRSFAFNLGAPLKDHWRNEINLKEEFTPWDAIRKGLLKKVAIAVHGMMPQGGPMAAKLLRAHTWGKEISNMKRWFLTTQPELKDKDKDKK